MGLLTSTTSQASQLIPGAALLQGVGSAAAAAPAALSEMPGALVTGFNHFVGQSGTLLGSAAAGTLGTGALAARAALPGAGMTDGQAPGQISTVTQSLPSGQPPAAKSLLPPVPAAVQTTQAAGTTAADGSDQAAPYTPPPLDDSPHPTLNSNQLDTISVLQRHRDVFPMKVADLQKKIDDPKTPPDLKQALQQVKDDPTLTLILDATDKGGGSKHADGGFSVRDLDKIAKWDEVKQYNTDKASSYTQNYVPSDAKDPSSVSPRPITANDAAREFYQYSESLPSKLTPDVLHQIVDGELSGKKMPPQLIAAAQFYLDHPTEWAKMPQEKDGSVRRDVMLESIGKNVFLNDDETAAIQTIGNNRDTFMPKGQCITRDSLKKLVDDPNSSPDVKKSAQQLLDDPMLFGMLDNASRGECPSTHKKVNDGKINDADFDAFTAHLTTKNQTPPPLPPPTVVTTPQATHAVQDMVYGAMDDPDIKKEKGGGGVLGVLKNAFKAVVNKVIMPALKAVVVPVMKVAAKVEHIASMVIGFASIIPGIGELFAAASTGLEAVAGATDIATTAADGGDIKKAAELAGLGLAGAALGAALPGAGAVVMKTATGAARAALTGAEKVTTEVVAKTAAKGTEQAVVKGAEQGAVKGAEGGVVNGVESGAENAASRTAVTDTDQVTKKTAEASAEEAAAKTTGKTVEKSGTKAADETGEAADKVAKTEGAAGKKVGEEEEGEEVEQTLAEQLREEAEDFAYDQANNAIMTKVDQKVFKPNQQSTAAALAALAAGTAGLAAEGYVSDQVIRDEMEKGRDSIGSVQLVGAGAAAQTAPAGAESGLPPDPGGLLGRGGIGGAGPGAGVTAGASVGGAARVG